MQSAWRSRTEVFALPAILAALALDAAVPAWWSAVPAAVGMIGGIVLAVGIGRAAHLSRSIFIRRAHVAPIIWAITSTLAAIFLARAYLAFQQFQGGGAEEGTRTYDAMFVVLLLTASLVGHQGTLVARLALRAAHQPMLLLTASFASMIGVGTLLLTFPISVHSIEDISFLDALFTMTSAVCVTGLTVNDPATTYTGFGEAVILLGIQLGGIGIMTVAALVFQLRGGAALRNQSQFAEMFGTSTLLSLRRVTRDVVVATLAIELLGAFLLFALTAGDQRLDGRSALWMSVFTSVSAFCNAGFSLLPDSMISFQADTMFLGVIIGLVVLGGLGVPVQRELASAGFLRMRRFFDRAIPRPRRLTISTRVVLSMTAILIVAGAAGVAILESGGVLQELSWYDRITGAVFASAAARTAGFDAAGVGAMHPSTLLLMIVLMFIGGSPASTAGGIKTTTAAVLFATVRGEIKGTEPHLFQRALSVEVRRRATAIAALSGVIVFTALLGLTIVENKPFLALAFESVSAFSTTGLSTGITPSLSAVGKILLTVTMFVGRVGPLTIALAAGAPELQRHRLAQTTLSVG